MPSESALRIPNFIYRYYVFGRNVRLKEMGRTHYPRRRERVAASLGISLYLRRRCRRQQILDVHAAVKTYRILESRKFFRFHILRHGLNRVENVGARLDYVGNEAAYVPARISIIVTLCAFYHDPPAYNTPQNLP